MRQILHMTVHNRDRWCPPGDGFPSLPEPEYSELRNYAAGLQILKDGGDRSLSLSIRTPAENPALDGFFTRLRELGWEASHRFLPAEEMRGRFRYRIARVYSEADLDAAELLYLMHWPILTGCGGRDGECWIGEVEYVGDDWCGEHYRMGWRQAFGSVGAQNFFVNTELKDRMISAGLRGLVFHPLAWDRPEEAQGDYWEIDSAFRMPPCLLPLVNRDGPLDYEEERPHTPVELLYRRAEVSAMGDFDVAWPREEVGYVERRDCGHRVLVVTQKVRRFLQSVGHPFPYGVVRLLD